MTDNRDIVVLVADDEPSMLALLSAYLKSKGYKVIEASDGDRAWQLAHEHLPDLVILDVMMPAMSGWEVCRKIREALPLAHTGVIMLTGIGENLNEMTSPLYGADAHIDKPFEFSDLEERMKETLAKRKNEHTMGRPDGADEETEPGDDLEAEDSMPPSAADAGDLADSEAPSAPRPKRVSKASRPKPSAAKPSAAKAGKKASKKQTSKVGKKKARSSTPKSSKVTKKATTPAKAKRAAPKKAAKQNKKVKKSAAKKSSKKATRAKKTAPKSPAGGAGRAASKGPSRGGKKSRKKSKR